MCGPFLYPTKVCNQRIASLSTASPLPAEDTRSRPYCSYASRHGLPEDEGLLKLRILRTRTSQKLTLPLRAGPLHARFFLALLLRAIIMLQKSVLGCIVLYQELGPSAAPWTRRRFARIFQEAIEKAGGPPA
ncbi:unnamed protein product [Ectocarpus sp. 4 AP-2014]